MNVDLACHLLGESRPMQELRSLITQIAPTSLSVVIQGPTGSGKELVAQALHALSGRDGRLVCVNVAAIPDAMFEDEFFGHVRGAFTGAIRDHAGFFTEAHRGTVFLDEVGSLSASSQPKLLRVLETRVFRPVGGRADQRSDFRTIAATNESLDTLVSVQRFRRDLRCRLDQFAIRVPPLADRRSDIPLLTRHFARLMSGDRAESIGPDVLRVLEAYDWPDNVRELRHAVESSLALGDGVCLTVANVRAVLGHRTSGHAARGVGANALRRSRLIKLLEDCCWDTALAASQLGVHRSTIYRRMWRCGVTIPPREPRCTSAS